MLLRLGELIAQAEGAAALARRAQRAAVKQLNPKAARGLRADALAAVSRVFARERGADRRDRGHPLGGGRRRRRAGRPRAAPRPRGHPPRPGRAARRHAGRRRRDLRTQAPRDGHDSQPKSVPDELEPPTTPSPSSASARSSPTPRTPRPSGRNVSDGHYAISEVDPARWDPALYYDADPQAPGKTYSKIGGWVRDWDWDPLGWKLPIPPQGRRRHGRRPEVGRGLHARWRSPTRAGPTAPLDLDRTAVILGNAMAGEKHYLTNLRIVFPELARELEQRRELRRAAGGRAGAPSRGELREQPATPCCPRSPRTRCPASWPTAWPGGSRTSSTSTARTSPSTPPAPRRWRRWTRRSRASSTHEFDVAITGGVDRNMGVSSFVKFCAIGALSPTGTRPYAEGADGFVMGEGAALFVVKRLADAERDGDRIYAVRARRRRRQRRQGQGHHRAQPGGPAPGRRARLAQRRAVARGVHADRGSRHLDARSATSSRSESIATAFAGAQLAPGSVALGLGEVQHRPPQGRGRRRRHAQDRPGAARQGAAAEPQLRPAQPERRLGRLAVRRQHRAARLGGRAAADPRGRRQRVRVRRHELPHRHGGARARPPDHQRPAASISVPAQPPAGVRAAGGRARRAPRRQAAAARRARPRGRRRGGLANELRTALAEARQGRHLDPAAPSAAALRAPERIAIDYADGEDLVAKAELALRALQASDPPRGRRCAAAGSTAAAARRRQGRLPLHRPGLAVRQHAGRAARRASRSWPSSFDEADAIMAPLLEGRPLTDVIFADPADAAAMARAEEELRRTEITQPAVLTVDIALTRLLGEYGIAPDIVMGHSLGEYGALVAAGALSFEAALEAVSARGREMAQPEARRPRRDGGGHRAAGRGRGDRRRDRRLRRHRQRQLHPPGRARRRHRRPSGAPSPRCRSAATRPSRCRSATPSTPRSWPRPASRCGAALERLGLRAAAAADRGQRRRRALSDRDRTWRSEMLDLLARQVASPVQFVKGLHTLYDAGRARVRRGRAEAGAAGLRRRRPRRRRRARLATNHPKAGDVASFNQALCGLYAAGLGAGVEPRRLDVALRRSDRAPRHGAPRAPAPRRPLAEAGAVADELERLFAEFLERGRELMGAPTAGRAAPSRSSSRAPHSGCPGAEQLFDDANIGRLLRRRAGHRRHPRPRPPRDARQAHHPPGQGRRRQRRFETIDSLDDVIKLAARAGAFDLGEEFGVDAERVAALGRDDPARDRRRHRRAARRRHPARPALQDDDAWAPNCPTAGGSPTSCATTPA